MNEITLFSIIILFIIFLIVIIHLYDRKLVRDIKKYEERLQAKGIATRPGTHAIHMLNLYKQKFGLDSDDYPIAKDCNNNSMAIPLHNRMTKEDYDYIIETLHEF